ncbi:TonB-dependent receptor [Gemmatimonas sp.]|jgi:catecholate siderophore receptor|uniref:TonB-dependent receptor n=1 Tax=Gemmatimonas sp. TaxID=1962908 RepID=UPI0037BED494
MLAPLILTLAVAAVPQDTARRSFADTATPRPAVRVARPDTQQLLTVKVRAHAARSTRYLAPATSAATRTLTPLREVPQSVTVLGAPILADLNIQSMAKAVEYLPGITMGQGEGHRDAPTIRGQSSTADFFIDGVRDDAQYLRDTYNVQQIDAVKGANATVFGRGGGGGVLNRVGKRADWTPAYLGRVETGSWNQRRTTLDLNQPFGKRAAGRLNLLYENSDSFRRSMGYEKWGANPTTTVMLGRVQLRAGVERYVDNRTVDRGLPSANGVPSRLDTRVFVGNPDASQSGITVDGANAQLEFDNGHGFTFRSHSRAFRYDKYYENVFASSAVNAAGTQFSLGAYRDAVDRRSVFTQNDAIWKTEGRHVRSTLLVGTELSRQRSDQLRETGYFNNTATVVTAAVTAPTVFTPVTYRPSASDASNDATATVAAAFVQEQLHLGRFVQLVGGVRHDRFTIDVLNRRNNTRLARTDNLVSPRAAVVITPAANVSLYGSQSVSFLPSTGDQFTSLSVTAQTLMPERFRNQELGFKWDARPDFAITAAYFAVDRTNTTAPDPFDATRLVQSGHQRTTGAELGVQGSPMRGWSVTGGIGVQDARVVSRTAAARQGATVPLVPRTTASLFNKVQLRRSLAVGGGVVHQGQRYAAIDNAVMLPAFTRADAAAYLTLPRGLMMQLNVENVFDARYFATSHGNNNIMPGAPRAFRLTFGLQP